MRHLFIVCALLSAAGFAAFDGPGLRVSSPAFAHNGMMPSRYSCEGSDISPELHISGIPSGARSLALIMHDPDAPVKGGFTHWVVWNLSVKGTLPEDFRGASQGLNSAGKQGYTGMCPPSGTHHYHFSVYALDTLLDLDRNTDKSALESAMKGHILAGGTLTGLYRKVK